MKKCTISTKIVQLLTKHPEGLTEYGIANKLDIHRETVKAKIKYLLKKERIGHFTFKKQLRYFTLKSLVLYIIANCTELYPNQRKINKKLFIQKAKNMKDSELRDKLNKIGMKYGSLPFKELNSETIKEVLNGIIDIFYTET